MMKIIIINFSIKKKKITKKKKMMIMIMMIMKGVKKNNILSLQILNNTKSKLICKEDMKKEINFGNKD